MPVGSPVLFSLLTAYVPTSAEETSPLNVPLYLIQSVPVALLSAGILDKVSVVSVILVHELGLPTHITLMPPSSINKYSAFTAKQISQPYCETMPVGSPVLFFLLTAYVPTSAEETSPLNAPLYLIQSVPVTLASAPAPSIDNVLSIGGVVGVIFLLSQSVIIAGNRGEISAVNVPSLAILFNLLLISSWTSSVLK